MKIIVVGDGKVGYTLVKQLSAEGHDVTVIDSNPENLRRTEAIDVIAVTGNGASFKVCSRRPAFQASDLLIAVDVG